MQEPGQQPGRACSPGDHVHRKALADDARLPVGEVQVACVEAEDLARPGRGFAGVGKSLIAQVVALGPNEGVQYTEAILAGGAALISEPNSEEKQISGLDTSIGQRATEIQYGQPIADGFLAGLKARRSEIDAEMRRAGDVLARELAKDFAVPARDLPKAIRPKPAQSGGHSGSPMITINFNGTQRPNNEQMASIKRELAMALGGG